MSQVCKCTILRKKSLKHALSDPGRVVRTDGPVGAELRAQRQAVRAELLLATHAAHAAHAARRHHVHAYRYLHLSQRMVII